MPFRKFNYDNWVMVEEMRPSDILAYSPKGQNEDIIYDKIGRSTKLYRVIEEGMYNIKKEDYNEKGELKVPVNANNLG